jgi:hypothetical protein
MLWDGIVAAHQSTDMNGQRFLFRLWLIASDLWMCAWAYYLWRTCERFGQDLWCRTGLGQALRPLARKLLQRAALGGIEPTKEFVCLP